MGGSTAAGPRLCWLIFFGLLMYIRILHHNPCSLVGSFRQAEVARALLQSEIRAAREQAPAVAGVDGGVDEDGP